MTETDTKESLAILTEARKLANDGNVEAAMRVCQQYLSLYEGTAEIYFLMGILEVAARCDEDAITYFKKAIYLDPVHYEGLVNLALLATRQGDLQTAEKFWKRVRRISRTGSDS